MGYNYTLMILGTHPDLKFEEELYHDSNSGTYSCTENHWFMTHKQEKYDYTGSTDMEDYQYVFYLQNLKIDLDESLVSNRLKEFRGGLEELGNLVSKFEYRDSNESEYIKKSELFQGWEKIMKKWNKIESDPNIRFLDNNTDFAIEELQTMVNRAQGWEDKGYTDIKIIFGFTP
jgi:hypothetical protein